MYKPVEVYQIEKRIVDRGRHKMFDLSTYETFFTDLAELHPDLEITEICYSTGKDIVCELRLRSPKIVVKRSYQLSMRHPHMYLEKARQAFEHNRRRVRQDIMRHGMANLEQTQRKFEKMNAPTKVFKEQLKMGKEQQEFSDRWEEKRKEITEEIRKDHEAMLEKLIWGGPSGSKSSIDDDLKGMSGSQMFFDEASNIKPSFNQRHIMSHDPIHGVEHNGILWVEHDKINHVYLRDIEEAVNKSLGVPTYLSGEDIKHSLARKPIWEPMKGELSSIAKHIGGDPDKKTPLEILTDGLRPHHSWDNPLNELGANSMLPEDPRSPLRAFYKFTNLEYTPEEMLKWVEDQWSKAGNARAFWLNVEDMHLSRFNVKGTSLDYEEIKKYSITGDTYKRNLLI